MSPSLDAKPSKHSSHPKGSPRWKLTVHRFQGRQGNRPKRGGHSILYLQPNRQKKKTHPIHEARATTEA